MQILELAFILLLLISITRMKNLKKKKVGGLLKNHILLIFCPLVNKPLSWELNKKC